MKKIKSIGIVFIGIGVLNLFREVDGFYGYGGYVDNISETIIISLLLTSLGLIILLISNRVPRN